VSLRPPAAQARAAPVVALDYEIAQERASALGRLGRALEAALAALADYDNRHTERDATRARLVQDASDALWCFMVQREACGLRDPRPVLRHYGVPGEVYARMGVFSRR
jgi:transglutaminase-like putative cysteine protease